MVRKLREIRDKAKTLGPIGLFLMLIEIVVSNLFQDRLASWANHKLDERAVPVLKRYAFVALKFSAEHPFQTCIYIFAMFSAVIIGWSFVTKGKGSGDEWLELAVGTGKAKDGLTVWLENRTGNPRDECTLFLAALERFDEKARNFVARGSFSGVWLIKPRRLKPHSRSESGYLVQLPAPAAKHLITTDAKHERSPIVTRAAGVWRARINVITQEDKAYTEERFFRWEVGSVPTFIIDPTKQIS